MGRMSDGQILAMIAAASRAGAPDIRVEAPPYAATVEEMTDQGRLYVGPNGNLWAYTETSTTLKEYTNLADPQSADWQLNSRLTSTDVVEETGGTMVTNYIACKKDDVIRIRNFDVSQLTTGANARTQSLDVNLSVLDMSLYPLTDNAFVTAEENRRGAYEWEYTVGTKGDRETYSTLADQIAYMRFCGTPKYAVDDIIITVNEEIRESEVSGYMWSDTGVSYAHYVMTDEDYGRVTDEMLDRLDVSYVSSDKVLTVGKYTLRYDGDGIADIGGTE